MPIRGEYFWIERQMRLEQHAAERDEAKAAMASARQLILDALNRRNIPAGVNSLEENRPKKDSLPGGIRQGTTDFRRIGYGGPCPPSGTHRYFFNLYALDTTLSLGNNTTAKELQGAMKGHILAEAQFMGRFKR